jgi:two-component system, NtrC family, nitrogen regulation response regulator NtrX
LQKINIKIYFNILKSSLPLRIIKINNTICMAKILLVDDESSIRRTLSDILGYEGYKVEEAGDGMEALVKVKRNQYDLVLMDIKMPNMDGMEALQKMLVLYPEIPIIMISGHGTIDTAVESVKKGAFDFISKPPDLNRMLTAVRNALSKKNPLLERKPLIAKSRKINPSIQQEIIGKSPQITKIKETIEKVGATEARVLITGSNGTGKELVAKWLHEKSNRSSSPLVEVNCAAIPSELIESELFGHEKGSFTSAIKQRIGKFEQANNGTLFLDEIGDMSLSAQAKVLRALQENKIVRVGGDSELKVNVRVIAATNKNLIEEIAKGRFREDLYHRLAVIIIDMPSLKERSEDIPLLTQHFIGQICDEYGIPHKNIRKEAMDFLMRLHWSGNIRELRNVVERLIILSDQCITLEDANKYVYAGDNRLDKFRDIFEKFDSIDQVHDYIDEVYTNFREK